MRNAQPICATTDAGPVGIAHNGNLVNAAAIRAAHRVERGHPRELRGHLEQLQPLLRALRKLALPAGVRRGDLGRRVGSAD